MRFLLISILSLTIFSCVSPREATCEEAADAFRSDSLNIIVFETSGNPYQLFLKGKSPMSGKEVSFQQVNYTWAQWFIDEIEIGDTVVKYEGELKFYIHKKDTVLVFPFQCKGEIIE